MGFVLIATAVVKALQGAIKIVHAFRTEVYDIPVSSGHGHGFWDFYSYSSVESFAVRMSDANKYVSKMIARVTKDLSSSMEKYRTEIIEDMTENLNFETYQFEQCEGSVNQISYSGNEGKLNFYVYTFTPGVSKRNNIEILKTEQMYCKIEMRIAQDWILINHIKSSFSKTTNSLELQYLPTAIDSAKVVEAVSIAFAPAVLGLMKVPTKFLELLKASIKQKVEDPYSGISKETYEQSEKLFDDMINRQKEKDELYQEGVKEIGEAASSLKLDKK